MSNTLRKCIKAGCRFCRRFQHVAEVQNLPSSLQVDTLRHDDADVGLLNGCRSGLMNDSTSPEKAAAFQFSRRPTYVRRNSRWVENIGLLNNPPPFCSQLMWPLAHMQDNCPLCSIEKQSIQHY